MRINPVNIGISNSIYNPVRWVGSGPAPQASPGNVTDQYVRSQLVTPYETTNTANPGSKAIAVANFAAADMDIWKTIKKQFGIELINTVESRFSRKELELIL
ncbi:MAG: hypothetical protein WC838_03295, partial [Candidatus Margulisiibacteriota bacterium]